MEIPFTNEQEAELVAAAEHEGKAISDWILETVKLRLQTGKYFQAKLDRSIEQANRGEFIEEEEMDRRFASMLAGK